jgi:hypothetical protein
MASIPTCNNSESTDHGQDPRAGLLRGTGDTAISDGTAANTDPRQDGSASEGQTRLGSGPTKAVPPTVALKMTSIRGIPVGKSFSKVVLEVALTGWTPGLLGRAQCHRTRAMVFFPRLGSRSLRVRSVSG